MKTGLDTTDDSFRARQKDPGSFDGDSFRTISFGQSKKEEALDWLEATGMRTHQFKIQENAPKGMVQYAARILAAVPGKSLNGRIYTRELLQQTAPLYPSQGFNIRPFILDHDIEHVERVTGLITGARYDVEEAMDGSQVEGLWLDAMGFMPEEIFAKMEGSKTIPPFVRGVSIGGEGEGEWTGNGVLIKKFYPAELSVTAFPGIPQAHIADLERIRESYARAPVHSDEVNKTTFQIQEREVSLEDAEKQRNMKRNLREGPLPGPDPGYNDSRPGLPSPTVRTTVSNIQPAATTSSDSGFKLNPEDPTAGRARIGGAAPVGQYARGGYSPTSTPGFGKLSKSGTGLPEQEAAPGTAAGAGAHGSRDAKAHKIKTPKTGSTTTTHPGHGNLSPSGTGMDSDDEEEEESMRDMGDQTHPKPGSQDMPGKHTDLKRSKNPSMSKAGQNPHDKNADDGEEEEEERVRVRHAKAADDDGDGDSDDDGEEEEESPEEEEERLRIRHAENPMQDHPGKSCSDAHPGQSHASYKDDMDDEEEEEHGPSPHIPGKPTGKFSGHSADDAYDSPSDQDSEEEEEERRLRVRQDDEPHGVTKKMKPGTGDEEEEEDGVDLDPVRKAAGQGQNVNANPTKEESQAKVLFSEAEPIEGRAFSLPTNSGILQTLSHMVSPEKAKEAMQKGSVEELVKALTRPDQYISREQVAELIEAWNAGKRPKEQKPHKIVIERASIGRSKDVSVRDARRPPEVAEGIVKTRSLTNTAPTFAATAVSTIPKSRLQDLLDEENKRPYSNVSYLNAAKRAWNRAVQDLIQFR